MSFSASVLEGEPSLEASSSELGRGSWADLAVVVRRAQAGDRDAFGDLIVQFEPTVHAIALRRLGNANDALELTQDVFLHVLKRLDQLREPERFAGWLKQMAARMAINRATRRLPPPSVENSVLEASYGPRESALDALIAREHVDRLTAALATLKAIDREALDAFYLKGLSLIEMAALFEVPVGTVKRRLHTARKRLKQALEDSVADPGEWCDDDLESCEESEDLDLVGVTAERGW